MKYALKHCLLLASFLFVTNVSAANFCSDTVIDEAGVLNSSQINQVTKAEEKLTRQGVDVRVRLLNDLKGASSLEELKSNAQQKCSSWKSKDGGMKNNLLILMVAPKQGKTGFFFGDALASKLSSKQLQIQSEMNAKFRDGNIAAGILSGLENVSDLMEVKISQQDAKQIVINHAADTSGITNVLGWIVGLLTLAGLGWLGMYFSGEKERRRNAQSNAKDEQGRSTTAINGFEVPYVVLKSRIKKSTVSETQKSRLLEKLEEVKSRFNTAMSGVGTVNRSQSDPDTPNLSVAEYERIAFEFKRVADKLDLLIAARDAIGYELDKLEVTPPLSGTSPKAAPSPAPSAPSSGLGSRASSRKASHQSTPRAKPPTPASSPVIHGTHTTTVVTNSGNDGFLTGVLVGDMLSRDSHHHHHDDYRTPTSSSQGDNIPSTEGRGSETGWGKTSDGNGTETTWGKSSSGGGSESTFGGANFGASSPQSETSTKVEVSDCRPTDCAPSDCKPSDCAASDCAASDCNCDCNCDCSSPD